MTNGTIQPFSEIEASEIRECQFIISAISNYKIQITCSNLNLTTQLSAYTYLSVSIRLPDAILSCSPSSS
jgi:hypothetical protein